MRTARSASTQTGRRTMTIAQKINTAIALAAFVFVTAIVVGLL